MSRDGPRRPAEGDETGRRTAEGFDDEDPADDDLREAVEELLEDLDELEAVVDSPAEREHVRETRRQAVRALARRPRAFGNVIRGFDRADAAEALLGSVLFGIPMLVEDGTFEVGRFIAERPPFYLGTVAFGVAIVVGILYVSDIQDVRIHEPLFGVVPRRLAGVLAIAFLTSLALATAWGRVDWADPRVALAQVVVAAVPMAIGGALGDILPGT